MLRHALLWGSDNRWLREHLPRWRFARRAVRRFMPGEDLEAALTATADLRLRGIGTVLTQLGENITQAAEAEAVREHYLHVLERIRARRLDAIISVKPTQLGIDIDPELAYRSLATITARAAALAGPEASPGQDVVWIDMEGSAYTDRTLHLFRRVHAEHPNLGICLQSYLRRTRRDLEDLLAFTTNIRLVKGAYAEPPEIAYADKDDVDESYRDLAARLLIELKATGGARGRPVFGTHDMGIVRWIGNWAGVQGLDRDRIEVQMLYGIGREDQLRLAGEGYRVRVLISYGSAWFPWFMRRLAERPANLLFVGRNLVPEPLARLARRAYNLEGKGARLPHLNKPIVRKRRRRR